MAKMPANQRVVKSMPDNNGRAYTKTSEGGKARIGSAVKYMDEKEQTRLYDFRDNELKEIDRMEALSRIDETETKYQQHLAFTTKIEGDNVLTPEMERRILQQLGEAIQQRRPDAEIYALAVHRQGEDGNIHVHAAVGTKTTLRHDDLPYMRQQAYQLERNIQHELEKVKLKIRPSTDPAVLQRQQLAAEQEARQQAKREAEREAAKQPRTEPPNLDPRHIRLDVVRQLKERQAQAQLKVTPTDQDKDEGSKGGKGGGREAEAESGGSGGQQENKKKQLKRDGLDY